MLTFGVLLEPVQSPRRLPYLRSLTTRAAILLAPTISRCIDANDFTNNSRGSTHPTYSA